MVCLPLPPSRKSKHSELGLKCSHINCFIFARPLARFHSGSTSECEKIGTGAAGSKWKISHPTTPKTANISPRVHGKIFPGKENISNCGERAHVLRELFFLFRRGVIFFVSKGFFLLVGVTEFFEAKEKSFSKTRYRAQTRAPRIYVAIEERVERNEKRKKKT